MTPGISAQTLDSSQSTNYEAEMAPADNPLNPLQEAAVVMANGTQIYAYNSFDGGKTWTSTNLTSLCLTNFAYDPGVAFDANGNVFASAIDNGDFFIFKMPYSPTGSNPWSYDSSDSIVAASPPAPVFDKESIATGWDQVHSSQALYATMLNGSLMGWDINSQGNLSNFKRFAANAGISGWSAPVIDASGNVYVATGDLYNDYAKIQVERLTGGLWSGANNFDTTVTVDTPSYDLFKTPVPAAPVHGIFASPTLTLEGSGALDLTYTLPNQGFVAGSSSTNPTTQVVFQRCTTPSTSLSSWSSPVAVDPNVNVTQFHPVIASDSSAPNTIAVDYYTTDGDSTYEAVKSRVAVSVDGGAHWSHGDLSTTTSNMYTFDQYYNLLTPGSGASDYLEYNGVSMYDGTIHGVWAGEATGSDGKPHVWAYTATAAVTSGANQNALNINTTGSVTVALDSADANYIKVTSSGGQILYDGLLATLGEIVVGSTTTATVASDLNDMNLTIDAVGNVNFTTSQHLNALIIESYSMVTLPGAGTFNTAPLYVNTLTMNDPTNSLLDLGVNSLVINNSSSAIDSTIRQDLLDGQAAGGWHALQGISTSVTTVNGQSYTLGYTLRSNNKELVMFTLAGDANLNDLARVV